MPIGFGQSPTIYRRGFDGILGMEHGNFNEEKDDELAVIKAYYSVYGFESNNGVLNYRNI